MIKWPLTVTALLLSLFSANLYAKNEVIRCSANVALNRVYHVVLDQESRDLAISSDRGSRYQGLASHSFSASTGNNLYYLPLGFAAGFELEIEAGGANRIALCFSSSECYLCR